MRLTEPELLPFIKLRKGKQTQRVFAKELGITPQFLNDILHGTRQAGPLVLKALRLKKIVSYEFIPRNHGCLKCGCMWTADERLPCPQCGDGSISKYEQITKFIGSNRVDFNGNYY